MQILQILFGTPEYDEALKLRYKVLREPLNLDFEVEQIESEWDSYHLAIVNSQHKIIAYLMLTPTSKTEIKMRQVVVDFDQQKAGIGSDLVTFSEHFCRENGFQKMSLHARDTAVPFYNKLNYMQVGEPFIEVGITHFEMYKVL